MPTPASPQTGGASQAAAKADCETVLSPLLEFAEKMLREQGGFIPFAGGLTKNGKVTLVGAIDGDENQPQDAEHLMKILTAALKAGARKGDYTATGLVVDGRVVPPGQATKSDAIIAQLDHASGYSIQLFVPYRFDEKRQPVFGETFAMKGSNAIFPAK